MSFQKYDLDDEFSENMIPEKTKPSGLLHWARIGWSPILKFPKASKKISADVGDQHGPSTRLNIALNNENFKNRSNRNVDKIWLGLTKH